MKEVMGPTNRPPRFSKIVRTSVSSAKVEERKTGDGKLKRMSDKIYGTGGKKANGADL
jgi:hypothetical protein